MKILRASRRVPPCLGGQEIHVAELTKGLARLGVEQHLVFEEGDAYAALGDAKAIARALGRSHFPSNILKDAVFGGRVVSYARRNQADIIHTHGDTPVARGGSLAARVANAVHIHTFHAGLISHPIKRTILRAFLPTRSYYLVVSPHIAGELAATGVSPRRIWVRSSGVREEFFRSRPDRREPVVAIGGRLGPLRRVVEVVEKWVTAPPDGITLSVFGTGPDADRIRRLANSHPSVEWHGRLGIEDLAELLQRAIAGIVLTRSDLAEGTPTLALEMMAAGCAPFVAEGAGLAPRLVQELGFGAIATDVPTPNEVAEVVKRYSGSRTEPKRRAAYQYIKEHHSWEGVAKSVAAHYERLLGGDGSPL